jgi:O-antigen ligase
MNLLFAIAALVVLVWGSLILLRGGLLASCLLLLLAGSCFGFAFFNLPGAIPLTIDRGLWVVVLVQYFICWRLGYAEPKPIGKADVVLALFLTAIFASTMTHDWRADHLLPVSRFVFYYVMPTGLYWVARNLPQTERGTYAILASLLGFGLYLAFTAFAETHLFWNLVFPGYITSSSFKEFLGRGRGPFLNPAGCGMFQSVCLAAVLLWWPRFGKIGRVLLALVALFLCAGIYWTLTRSAWMGGALALAIVLVARLPRNWRLPLVGGAALLSVVVVATQWEKLLSFKRDQQLSAAETADSAQLRPLLAALAWQMFLDRPVFGCGFGQYMEERVNYTSDRSIEMPLEKARPYVQHNVFLGLLTETGLVGTTLFILLLGLWVHGAWKIERTGSAPDWVRTEALLFLATVGAYVANGMFQDVAIIPMVHMLLFFLAGLTQGLLPYAAGAKRAPVMVPEMMTIRPYTIA